MSSDPYSTTPTPSITYNSAWRKPCAKPPAPAWTRLWPAKSSINWLRCTVTCAFPVRTTADAFVRLSRLRRSPIGPRSPDAETGNGQATRRRRADSHPTEAEAILALLAQHISTRDRRFVDFPDWSRHRQTGIAADYLIWPVISDGCPRCHGEKAARDRRAYRYPEDAGVLASQPPHLLGMIAGSTGRPRPRSTAPMHRNTPHQTRLDAHAARETRSSQRRRPFDGIGDFK